MPSHEIIFAMFISQIAIAMCFQIIDATVRQVLDLLIFPFIILNEMVQHVKNWLHSFVFPYIC